MITAFRKLFAGAEPVVPYLDYTKNKLHGMCRIITGDFF